VVSGGKAAKARGSAWERAVVAVLREHGHPGAARAYGAGRPDDVGDIAGVPGYALEAKRQAALKLATWMGEAVREAANVGPGTVPVLVVHRRGRPAATGWAIMRLADWSQMTSRGESMAGERETGA